MTQIPRWILPTAISVTVPLPSYAVQYLSVSQAQKLCFPEATQFVAAHILKRKLVADAESAAINKEDILAGLIPNAEIVAPGKELLFH